MYKIKLARI